MTRRRKSPKRKRCEFCGKISFKSPVDAVGSAATRVKYGAPPLRIYQCPGSPSPVWHQTSQNKRTRKA